MSRRRVTQIVIFKPIMEGIREFHNYLQKDHNKYLIYSVVPIAFPVSSKFSFLCYKIYVAVEEVLQFCIFITVKGCKLLTFFLYIYCLYLKYFML